MYRGDGSTDDGSTLLPTVSGFVRGLLFIAVLVVVGVDGNTATGDDNDACVGRWYSLVLV